MRSKDVYKFLSITKKYRIAEKESYCEKNISQFRRNFDFEQSQKEIYIYKNGIFINNDRR